MNDDFYGDASGDEIFPEAPDTPDTPDVSDNEIFPEAPITPEVTPDEEQISKREAERRRKASRLPYEHLVTGGLDLSPDAYLIPEPAPDWSEGKPISGIINPTGKPKKGWRHKTPSFIKGENTPVSPVFADPLKYVVDEFAQMVYSGPKHRDLETDHEWDEFVSTAKVLSSKKLDDPFDITRSQYTRIIYPCVSYLRTPVTVGDCYRWEIKTGVPAHVIALIVMGKAKPDEAIMYRLRDFLGIKILKKMRRQFNPEFGMTFEKRLGWKKEYDKDGNVIEEEFKFFNMYLAKDLKPGDMLQDTTGRWIRISRVDKLSGRRIKLFNNDRAFATVHDNDYLCAAVTDTPRKPVSRELPDAVYGYSEKRKKWLSYRLWNETQALNSHLVEERKEELPRAMAEVFSYAKQKAFELEKQRQEQEGSTDMEAREEQPQPVVDDASTNT